LFENFTQQLEVEQLYLQLWMLSI